MNKKNSIYMSAYVWGIMYLFPVVVSAQGITDLEDSVGSVFRRIPPILIGIAVVFFLWQLVKFIRLADNEKERDEAKGLMVYGIIAILVMVSLWGIVGLLTGIFDLENDRTLDDFEEIVPEGP